MNKERERWKRWLGQQKKYGCINLMDTNYKSWAKKILRNQKIDTDKTIEDLFSIAIAIATLEELQELDCIVLDDKKEVNE